MYRRASLHSSRNGKVSKLKRFDLAYSFFIYNNHLHLCESVLRMTSNLEVEISYENSRIVSFGSRLIVMIYNQISMDL
jgi:hypothetical protein